VALFDSLSEVVAESMERLAVPGVAVGVLDQGKEHIAGFGVTSVDNPLPVDADTLLLIGSTTKTVTATAAMRLVEAGRLDLESPIRAYLPDLRLASEDVAAHVTMRHRFRPLRSSRNGTSRTPCSPTPTAAAR
jgi:CubicO group peptidase (beta-lactamase class C family)